MTLPCLVVTDKIRHCSEADVMTILQLYSPLFCKDESQNDLLLRFKQEISLFCHENIENDALVINYIEKAL